MLFTFVNYSLVFAVSVNTLLFLLLIKQNAKMPVVKFYAAIVLLITLDLTGIICILNSSSPETIGHFTKIHFGLICLIFSVLHYFSGCFTFLRDLPKPKTIDIVLFLVAITIATLPFLEGANSASSFAANRYLNVGKVSIWALSGLFILTTLLILRHLKNKYKKLISQSKNPPIKGILFVILPITTALFACVYIFPYLGWGIPVFFSMCGAISMLLYLCAQRYQILELSEDNQYLMPQFIVSSFFMLIFYFTLNGNKSPDLNIVLLSIPFLIAGTLLGYYILIWSTNAFKKIKIGYDQLLDQKMEQFSTDLVQFIAFERLWDYLIKFCKNTLDVSKIAIITRQYDISPYQIEHIEGFSYQNIKKLLNEGDPNLLEKVELDGKIINKFDLSNKSNLFKMMDKSNIYIGIPLIKKTELMGIILLGGDRQYLPIPRRNIHVLKLMSGQIAVVVENIRAIQSMVQSQKMAGLGMVASQLAHDFKSFIALTKTYTRENKPLIKHARYMDKLVDDLLDYANVEELNLTPININQFIEMSLDLIQIPPEIKIEKNFEENLSEIKLDNYQMRRVITNLINNSIRAIQIRNGNCIKITTTPFQPVSKVSKTMWANIEISDDGLGIAEEFIGRIFDPFFTTFKTEGGNGLGLAIVKQIIERHSGFINVTSSPGEGTTFNIRLPYQHI